MRSREYMLMIELLAATRKILAKDGHVLSCPKRKKSYKACTVRCADVRNAIEECQKFILDTHRASVEGSKL